MRLAAVQATPAPLFVYGTLLFPDVLQLLLGRVPDLEPARLEGWRAAAIGGQVFPVLVAAPGTTTRGLLVQGLTEPEWAVLDAYEDTFYEIATVVTVEGHPAWTYTAPAELTGPDSPAVLEADWDATVFAREHLTAFLARMAGAA